MELDSGESQQPAARVRRGGAVLGAALATGVVVIGVSFTLSLGGRLPSGLPDNSLPTNAAEGEVHDTFNCPDQSTSQGPRGERHDFRPSLAAGPAAEANRYGAARFEYVEEDRTAVLRLGNADASLASESEFTRRGGDWRLVTATRCAGVGGTAVVPTDDPLRLGEHEVDPWPAASMFDVTETDGAPVLVDDRLLYDTAGLLEHRSIYYAPCGELLCMVVGDPVTKNIDVTPVDDRPTDVSDRFVPTDLQRGAGHPFGLWHLYPAEDVQGMEAVLRSGRTVEAREFGVARWDRSLYVLLAPYDEVLFIRVRGADDRTYRTDELPGHTPR